MQKRRSFWLPTLSLVLLSLVGSGCSKDDSGPTGPGPGSSSFHSGDLLFGQQFVHTFPTAGHFGYHCNRHPMNSTIHVEVGGADSLVVLISGNTFLAQGSNVKPGGYVRWRNDDTVPHTVTSD